MSKNKIVAAPAAGATSCTLLLAVTNPASAHEGAQWCDRHNLDGLGVTDLCRSRTLVRTANRHLAYFGDFWMKNGEPDPYLGADEKKKFSVQVSADGTVTTKFDSALSHEEQGVGTYRRTRVTKMRLCHSVGTSSERCTTWL